MMSLKQSLKELSGHSFFYALTWIASSAASILLLPVYTRFLSRADYGILEILEYTNIIITILVAGGLNAAIPRFFNATEVPDEKKTVVSSATLFGLVVGGVFCLVTLIFSEDLSFLVLGKRGYKNLIDLNIGIFYCQFAFLLSSVGFIAAKRSKAYLAYMLGKLFITILANLYFIIIMNMGVTGMLLGSLLGSSSVALVITVHNLCLHGVKVSGPVIGRLLIFGLPLIPANLLATIMHNADRFLIRYYGSLDDVGIYSVGYKFPFMLNAVILQSFSYIWTGAAMYEVGRQRDSAYQFGRIGTYVIGLFVFSQLALSVFSNSIVRLLVDEKFFDARDVIPYVALGLCLHSFYFFFSVGSFLTKKTWLLNVAYLPAAAINVVGNMILLPRYGYMAAAWMSTVTYFVFAVVLYFSCRGLIRIDHEWKRLFMIFSVGIATFVASLLLELPNAVLDGVKNIALLGVFVITLLMCGFLTTGERASLRGVYAGLKASISKR